MLHFAGCQRNAAIHAGRRAGGPARHRRADRPAPPSCGTRNGAGRVRRTRYGCASGRTAPRRPLGLRTRGGCDDSRRIRAAQALHGRLRPRARGKDRELPAPHPGRPWRLAALSRRPVQHQRQRQGLPRAEGHRRFAGRTAHAPGAAGDPRAWWRRHDQRVHAHAARVARHRAVARRADRPGRDHAPAALVPVPPVPDFVLGPHGAGAAAGAAGAQAVVAPSARRDHRRTLSRPVGAYPPCAAGRAPVAAVVCRVRADRRADPLHGTVLPVGSAPAGNRQGRRVRHRATEWRGRPRRDFPGDGEHGDDVRRARLSERSPRPGHRKGGRREADRR